MAYPLDILAQATHAAATDPERAAAAAQVAELTTRFQELLHTLSMPTVLVVLAIGIVSLTYGWWAYRFLIVGMTATLGIFVGHLTANQYGASIGAAGEILHPALWIMGGGVLGFLAVPFLRAAVFAITGMAGGFVTYMAGGYIAPDYALAFFSLGFLVCGTVAIASLQVVIVLSTAVSGGVAIAVGLVWLLSEYAPLGYDWLLAHPSLLPLGAMLIAVVGVAIQLQLIPEGGITLPERRSPKGNRPGNSSDNS